MPSSSPRATFSALSPPIHSRSSSRELAAPASEGEVEQDELAFTIESPSQPQLQLFENIFNTGKLLASYCCDDPLWSTLAEVALPCSNCVRHPEACKVPEGSPHCSSQNLAYSQRFLELHRSPAQRMSWGIPEDAWCRYDNCLHSQISSTSILLELNMLDNQDTRAVDRRELECFQRAQEDGSMKKRRLTKTRSQPAPPPLSPSPPHLSSMHSVLAPRITPVSRQTGSVRDPEPLVQLAEVAGRQTGFGTGNAARFAVPVPLDIKGPQEDTDTSPLSMPPANRPALVPRILVQHPYCAENECLVAQVCLLQSQLASLRQENSTLASALRDTLMSLEARQGELKQLRASTSLSSQRQEEYDRLMVQVQALQRLLPGPIDKPLVNRFQDFEESHCVAREDRDRYLSRSASSDHRNEELEKSLIQQQSLVDESNALAVRQRKRIEALQEEVHCFRERALFVEKMVREYPEEGSYSVSHPPLAEVQGKLNNTLAALQRVATFAHRLYSIISFLRRGLDTAEPDIIVRSFQLALEFMEAARGVHAELHLRSLSSVQWFFHNAAEREKGTYCLILANSRFPDDAPFLNAAQHAGFLAPFEDSLELPVHRRMFALETALPHHDTPPPGSVSYQDVGVDPHEVNSPPPDVPLFLPDSTSPTSPLLPNPSPPPPPLFGAVATLAIDLTGEDNNEDLYESPSSRDHCLAWEVTDADGMEVDEGAPVKSESSVA
ncbi:hypothetical protein F5876DRAFT_82171 [Lentinula aff. lateritia]|uniref:Uncharacterized protein n=1 Tax=Lentinula aff. lateritia TaxID=2804960 RepID=A0ACC1TK37_9AGAR|nr:hypothetical protein F5876DRAFT_82171 [Lentinula aff. lateritia]